VQLSVSVYTDRPRNLIVIGIVAIPNVDIASHAEDRTQPFGVIDPGHKAVDLLSRWVLDHHKPLVAVDYFPFGRTLDILSCVALILTS
jgi:hypothetical protein